MFEYMAVSDEEARDIELCLDLGDFAGIGDDRAFVAGLRGLRGAAYNAFSSIQCLASHYLEFHHVQMYRVRVLGEVKDVPFDRRYTA